MIGFPKVGSTTNLRPAPKIATSIGYWDFEPEYVAILDKAMALGYNLPLPKQQLLQNRYLKLLKDSGLWTAKVVIYVFWNNGSKEFATINWKAPALYQCTINGGSLWEPDYGFIGDESTAYLDTNWRPVVDGGGIYVQDSANHAIDVVNMPTVGATGLAASGGGNQITLSLYKQGTTSSARVNQAAAGAMLYNGGSPGFHHANRSASNNQQLYLNGIFVLSNSTASTTIEPNTMNLGRRNRTTTPDGYGNEAFAHYSSGRSLSAEEMLLDYTLWNNYKNGYLSAL